MYYEMIVQVTTCQHLKAIGWSNLRWELVKRTFSFSPTNLLISLLSDQCESKDLLRRWAICMTSISHCIKMWWVRELIVPLWSLNCGKVSTSSSLVVLCYESHGMNIVALEMTMSVGLPLRSRMKYLHKYWIARMFCTDILGPQMMDSNDFGDPWTFHLVPPAGWHLLSNLSGMSRQLLDGLPWNSHQTSIVPLGWIIITSLMPLYFH